MLLSNVGDETAGSVPTRRRDFAIDWNLFPRLIKSINFKNKFSGPFSRCSLLMLLSNVSDENRRAQSISDGIKVPSCVSDKTTLSYLESKHGWSDVRLKSKNRSPLITNSMTHNSWLSLHCILASSISLRHIVRVPLVVPIIQVHTIHLNNTNIHNEQSSLKDH